MKMKTINRYINEKLRLTTKRTYTCKPKDKNELWKIIKDRLMEDGTECDLNDIDVSEIDDMAYLFNVDRYVVLKAFNGDISQWDVSNVRNMDSMFMGCEEFNCDISQWNTSKVEDMEFMFYGCRTFNGDLSKWNTSNVRDMNGMFQDCYSFDGISCEGWDVHNVTCTGSMFAGCASLKCDLSQWDISSLTDTSSMFEWCVNFNGNSLNSWSTYSSQLSNTTDMFTGCRTAPNWWKSK